MTWNTKRPDVQKKKNLFDAYRNGDVVPEFQNETILDIGEREILAKEAPNKMLDQVVRAHPSLVEYLTSNYYDRAMKIVVKDGYFCLAFCLGANKTWEDDYDDMVLELLDDDESCFIAYRLDEPHGRHFEHVLITWQPEDASISNRAVYTTSKSSLIELFEEGTFIHELHGSRDSDIDFNALKYVMMNEGEIEPLSAYEILKKQAYEEEDLERKRPLKKIPDIDMDMEDGAIKEINKFVKGFINFLQFGIDNKREIIRITDSTNITIQELPDKMHQSIPRFNLFRYSHIKDGHSREFVPVFIYHVPEEGSAMDRSLYPCAIDPFIKRLQGLEAGIKLRLEFCDMNDMTEGMLYEAIYPTDRETLERDFKAIKPTQRAGNRGGWVKVLPV